MQKTFTTTLFNRKIIFIFYNFWTIKDKVGDFYFPFKLFGIEIGRYIISLIILNFAILIGWYE